MITFSQIISELLVPLLGVLGIMLRPFGVLGAGVVAGTVLRHALIHKKRTRLFVPLIFLGVVVLFGFTAYGRWSGPGTLGTLGIGLFLGYIFGSRRDKTAVKTDTEAELSE